MNVMVVGKSVDMSTDNMSDGGAMGRATVMDGILMQRTDGGIELNRTGDG